VPELSSKFSLVLASIAIGAVASAQTPPDAGALRQQIERPLSNPALPENSSPLQAEPPALLALPDGVSITVRTFRITGNTLLGDLQLQAVVSGWLGRPIGFAELQAAAQAIASRFRAEGWIVRTYLPQQDVTDGNVTIQVVESKFAGARLEGAEPSRVRSSQALRLVEAQQSVGQPLEAAALDRALLLADDLPGVIATGALTPGERDGETALLVTLRDEPLIGGVARLDNGGARTTGATRALVTAALESPLRLGDRLRADALHSEGADYIRLGYSLPVGSAGWRVGLNASHFDYDLVAAQFASLDAHGDSDSIGIDASYPLIRARLRNLYFTVTGDERNFRNVANGATQSDYDVGSVSVGFAGNLYDAWGGGGANNFTLTWSRGRVRQGAADPGENAALADDFSKLRYAISRQQLLTPTLSLYGALTGQYATNVLDSSERFYLGGPEGVRAYPVNDGGGSRSELVNVELRWRIHPSLLLSGFTDWGHVDNFGDGRDATLRSFGGALGWSGPQGLQVQTSYAVRGGSNPNPGASGAYQDGTRHRNRWWLQASLSF
jgi:hemolysin activation/secretion protein